MNGPDFIHSSLNLAHLMSAVMSVHSKVSLNRVSYHCSYTTMTQPSEAVVTPRYDTLQPGHDMVLEWAHVLQSS